MHTIHTYILTNLKPYRNVLIGRKLHCSQLVTKTAGILGVVEGEVDIVAVRPVLLVTHL